VGAVPNTVQTGVRERVTKEFEGYRGLEKWTIPVVITGWPTKWLVMSKTHDDEIIHRELDTDKDPAVAVVEVIADIESMDVGEMPISYECIDGMLTEMYSNPPSEEAQVEVNFTYADYRVTVDQDGGAKFVKVGDTP
jgi:hypothetical protein